MNRNWNVFKIVGIVALLAVCGLLLYINTNHGPRSVQMRDMAPPSSDMPHTLHPNAEKLFTVQGDVDWNGTPDPYIFGYAAYYDDRHLRFDADALIVLGVIRGEDRVKIGPRITCGVYYGDELHESVPDKTYHGMEYLHSTADVITDFTYFCPLDTKSRVPSQVKLMLDGEPLVSLPVIVPPKPEKMGELLVCTKELYIPHDYNYEPLDDELFVDWVEMNRLLGVDHITVHIHSLTPNMQPVLYHYYKTGFIDFVSIGPIRGDTFKFPRQIGPNDCIYRNMHSYRYIINIDPDEVIVPRHFPKLTDFLKAKTQHVKCNSVVFNPKVFYTDATTKTVKDDGAPHSTFFVNNVYVCNGNTKIIFPTDGCLKVSAHLCVAPVEGTVRINATFEDGACYHFKSCETARRDNKPRDCERAFQMAEEDTRMMVFRDEHEKYVQKTIAQL